jgi:hypothetical protein
MPANGKWDLTRHLKGSKKGGVQMIVFWVIAPWKFISLV